MSSIVDRFSNLLFLITSRVRLSPFLPVLSARGCLAARSPRSGIGCPGSAPNHKNGPNSIVVGSNLIQMMQALRFCARPTCTLTVLAAALTVARFQLDVSHAAVAFQNQIITRVVDLSPQEFDVPSPQAPETPQQVPHEQVLQDFFPETGMQELRVIGHGGEPGAPSEVLRLIVCRPKVNTAARLQNGRSAARRIERAEIQGGARPLAGAACLRSGAAQDLHQRGRTRNSQPDRYGSGEDRQGPGRSGGPSLE